MDRNALAAGVLPRAWQFASWKARYNSRLKEHLIDSATEAVVRALNAYDPARGEFEPYAMAWVARVVIRQCSLFLARQRAEPTCKSLYLDPENPFDPADDGRPIAGEIPMSPELLDLPSKYLDPVRLYFLEGFTLAEVGGRLGIGESAVRWRLERAALLLAADGAVPLRNRGKRRKRG